MLETYHNSILTELARKNTIGLFAEIPEADIEGMPDSIRRLWRIGKVLYDREQDL